MSAEGSIQSGRSDIAKSLREMADRIDRLWQSRNKEAQVAKARAVYSSRRLRGRSFGSEDLFGEPAWDMLLDLYIADFDHRAISVSSLCIAANVPTSTAMRWILLLQSRGLVERRGDDADKRRVYVHLTDAAKSALDRHFANREPLF